MSTPELSANADAGCNRKVYYSNECLANKARKTMQRLHGTRFLYYECKDTTAVTWHAPPCKGHGMLCLTCSLA